MGRVTGARAAAAALVMGVVMGVAGCSGGGEDGGSGQPAVEVTPTPVNGGQPGSTEPLTLAITPAVGAKKQPISTEIGTKVTGGTVTDVSLTDAGGGKVSGTLREDGSSWVPASPLKYGKTYKVSVTATGPGGQTETKTTSFSTMSKPGSVIGSGLYLFDDRTYGVAMPVVVEFSPGIPKKDRAAVQKRMFVKTDPPQPGAWHWVANGTQAYYRAPQYWQPNTTITVRIGLAGVPLSNGRYGNTDRGATAKIGSRFEMKVDNATKKMSVYENDKLIKTMPVSLGKKSTPSSSGTMVVMEKKEATVFDTRDDPNPANRRSAPSGPPIRPLRRGAAAQRRFGVG